MAKTVFIHAFANGEEGHPLGRVPGEEVAMRSRTLTFIGLLGLGLAAGIPLDAARIAHAELVVDRFAAPGDGSSFFAPTDPPYEYIRQDSGPGFLNGAGVRDMRLELVGTAPFLFNAAQVYMPPDELFVATFGPQGARLHLEYDAGPSGIDLTEGGVNSMFVLRFRSIDPGGPGFGESLRVVTTITDLDGATVELTSDLPEAVVPTGYELRFSDFALTSPSVNPPVDPLDVFRNAASLHFLFNAHEVPVPNVDFSILSIVAVPEPSGILLGLTGLMVALGLGRPRRRQAA